jgi:iron complex outermembrane receptor protein
VAFILNAASSHIYGLDGQFTAKLTDHFEIQAAGAWTHARYVNFNPAPVYVPCGPAFSAAGCFPSSFNVPGSIINGGPMQRAPSFTGDVMLRYTDDLAGGKLDLSGSLNYTSKLYFGPAGNQFPQNGYATLSLRAQWTDPSKRYWIAVFGDNVTDEHYKTEVQATTFGIGSNWSKPVTYGVELGVKFH